eukprot:TRINITY_DN1254_c0_g2_i4.p1 TRINITY_DN1254_c0_g2~~TRINITY_DN1254_c0_g2_i4.p1  ORF type:complete len:288 (+),score=45.20 TRINITY_DN1254_c0_g2_i4:476-1339(+)
MGFPSQNFEKIYRNNMVDVQRFLEKRHAGHYRVYNLCSERNYDESCFNNNVGCYPFDDHQAPPFHLIFEFCQDIDAWLKKDPANIAAVHCKAGKGRTGLMVCCYLIFSKMFPNAYEALRYYGMIRTKNTRGLTIPSQIRYVFYFEESLQKGLTFRTLPVKRLKINLLRLTSLPNLGITGRCEPWFRLKCGSVVYSSKDDNMEYPRDGPLEFQLEDIYVVGDVKLEFFSKGLLNMQTKLFSCWFNTYFVATDEVFVLEKYMLDKAWKDKDHKIFDPDFALEIETEKAL